MAKYGIGTMPLNDKLYLWIGTNVNRYGMQMIALQQEIICQRDPKHDYFTLAR